MPARLDHVTIATTRFAECVAFYDAALLALGVVRIVELVDEEEDGAEVEAVAWGPDGGAAFVWVVSGDRPTSAVHLRLATDSREQVVAFYSAALAAGGGEHAAPRRWAIYRRGEFGASVRDPAGNLLEAVCLE